MIAAKQRNSTMRSSDEAASQPEVGRDEVEEQRAQVALQMDEVALRADLIPSDNVGVQRRNNNSISQNNSSSGSLKPSSVAVVAGASDKHSLAKPKRRRFFNPSDAFCHWWSAIVSLAFLYNFWSLSYRFAFKEIDESTVTIWFLFDYSADFIYLIDILVNFRTGYLEDGVLQRDPNKIGIHYRESTFFYLDMLCLLPFDILYLSVNYWSILRCNKLVKIYKFWSFVDRTERHTNYPNVFRTFTLVHYILVIFHWNACLFYMISKHNVIDITTLYKINDNQCDDILCRYLHAFYWSTLALTLIGDLPRPRTHGEYIYVIVELCFGLFLFASVLGHVANIVTNVSAARKEFQAKLDAVKTFMRTRRVSDDLQNKVIRWFDYLWYSQKSSDEERSVACLPDRLKAEIAIHVNLDTLKRVDIFQNTEAGFLCELVLRLKPVLFSPGDYVCRKNEVGHEMYIVSRGVLEVVTDDGQTVVATFRAGSYFGEIAVLNVGSAGNKRTASVRSVGYSDLFCLSKRDLWDVLKDYPNAEARIRAVAEERLSKLSGGRNTSCAFTRHRKNNASDKIKRRTLLAQHQANNNGNSNSMAARQRLLVPTMSDGQRQQPAILVDHNLSPARSSFSPDPTASNGHHRGRACNSASRHYRSLGAPASHLDATHANWPAGHRARDLPLQPCWPCPCTTSGGPYQRELEPDVWVTAGAHPERSLLGGGGGGGGGGLSRRNQYSTSASNFHTCATANDDQDRNSGEGQILALSDLDRPHLHDHNHDLHHHQHLHHHQTLGFSRSFNYAEMAGGRLQQQPHRYHHLQHQHHCQPQQRQLDRLTPAGLALAPTSPTISQRSARGRQGGAFPADRRAFSSGGASVSSQSPTLSGTNAPASLDKSAAPAGRLVGAASANRHQRRQSGRLAYRRSSSLSQMFAKDEHGHELDNAPGRRPRTSPEADAAGCQRPRRPTQMEQPKTTSATTTTSEHECPRQLDEQAADDLISLASIQHGEAQGRGLSGRKCTGKPTSPGSASSLDFEPSGLLSAPPQQQQQQQRQQQRPNGEGEHECRIDMRQKR